MPSILLALAACTGTPPAPEPAPAPAPQAPADPGFRVEPVSIAWDAERHAVAVEAKLAGDALAERTEPVYVGVTVITEKGEEVDLLVHTLFPGSLDQALQFEAELAGADATPEHVLIGAWSTKVEPCAVDRPGCKAFGFVLDDSLASFPAKLYTEGMRQRFLPKGDAYIVHVMGDPGAVSGPAGRFASVFGASVAAEAVPSDPSAAPGVWVGAKDDLGFAHEVARQLGEPGEPLAYGQKDGLNAPMLVVLPH